MELDQNPSVYELATLEEPGSQFNLEHLLNRGAHHQGFETTDSCLEEDKKRAAALRSFPWDLREYLDTADRHDLVELLDDYARYDRSTGASATCMRNSRLRFLGATLKFAAEHTENVAALITVSHPSWQLRINDRCWDQFHLRTPLLLRTLLRVAGVITAPGFLITFLHCRYEPKPARFLQEFRGICAGEKLRSLLRLRDELSKPENSGPLRDYTDTNVPYVSRLITSAHRITNLPRQIEQMMPNAVPAGSDVPYRRQVQQRVPEPDHSAYVIWRHLYRHEPLSVMSGVAIQDRQLVSIQES